MYNMYLLNGMVPNRVIVFFLQCNKYEYKYCFYSIFVFVNILPVRTVVNSSHTITFFDFDVEPKNDTLTTDKIRI